MGGVLRTLTAWLMYQLRQNWSIFEFAQMGERKMDKRRWTSVRARLSIFFAPYVAIGEEMWGHGQ
jgi:hypothetical protein